MRRSFWIIGFLLILCILAVGYTQEDNLTITFFKAGKADAFLFQYGAFTLLLDAGEADDAQDIIAYAQEKGITALDVVILTHFDQGHIGGMPEIMGKLSVKRVLMPDLNKDSESTQLLYQALMDHDLSPEYVDTPMTLELPGLRLTILPSDQEFTQPDLDDQDDASLVVSVLHGENSFLFTGDIGSKRMEMILAEGSVSRHTFLKVPAHGRNAAAFQRFLEAVAPSYAVITCSNKNPPAGAVTEALMARGIPMWLTKNGDITLTSDGKEITVKQ